MFIPPINLGGWKPSPATMSEWIYQIWKYLQENPIATQEQIKEFINEQIGDDISEKLPDILPEELDKYFEENPIDFPVDSVNGKLGAVLLELADIVQSDSMLPVVSLANDEADQVTLVNAFIDGARICVIDEESVSVMLPTYGLDGGVTAITLLPMSTGGGSGGDFSPITLSIGSSGNKTLNSGGTVAFTLTEIGAAPASLETTVSGINGRLVTAETNISTMSGDITDIQDDIDTLESTARTVYKVGDTLEINTAFRVSGNFANNTMAGFTLILPIVLDANVTGFTLENASVVALKSARSSTTVVSHNIQNNTSYYCTGTIGDRNLGILSFNYNFPQISTGDAGYMALIAFPSSTPTILKFT